MKCNEENLLHGNCLKQIFYFMIELLLSFYLTLTGHKTTPGYRPDSR